MTTGDPAPPGTEPVRLEAVVRGRVQGVGFRYFVWREAQALGLRGWVSNESDGTVRCLAEGPRADLDDLLGRLEAGPPGAIVEGVVTTWSPPTGALSPFGVRAGAHRGD